MALAFAYQKILVSNLQKSMKQNYYKVGGHCFCVEAEEYILDKMVDYLPFKVDESYASTSLFTVIDVDLVDREGKLIDSSASLYRTKMREVLNG